MCVCVCVCVYGCLVCVSRVCECVSVCILVYRCFELVVDGRELTSRLRLSLIPVPTLSSLTPIQPNTLPPFHTNYYLTPRHATARPPHSGNNAVRRIQLYPNGPPGPATPTRPSPSPNPGLNGFAVTVAVAEPDTDADGMVYDFAALKTLQIEVRVVEVDVGCSGGSVAFVRIRRHSCCIRSPISCDIALLHLDCTLTRWSIAS